MAQKADSGAGSPLDPVIDPTIVENGQRSLPLDQDEVRAAKSDVLCFYPDLSQSRSKRRAT